MVPSASTATPAWHRIESVSEQASHLEKVIPWGVKGMWGNPRPRFSTPEYTLPRVLDTLTELPKNEHQVNKHNTKNNAQGT